MCDHHHEQQETSSTGTSSTYSRRIFMQQGMAFLSMATTVPLFMQRSAEGIMIPLGSLVTSRAGVPDDHVLVVIQLAGGNDGLNTVIPYGSREYYTNRSQIAIGEPGSTKYNAGAALSISGADGYGLHRAIPPQSQNRLLFWMTFSLKLTVLHLVLHFSINLPQDKN